MSVEKNKLKTIKHGFQKGESGNPNGRPKGVGNKLTTEIRQIIRDRIDIEHMFDVLEELEKTDVPKAIELKIRLLPYIAPRLKEVDLYANITNERPIIQVVNLYDQENDSIQENKAAPEKD